MLEEIAETEADEQIGAVRYERGAVDRADYRNGHRLRTLGTSLGEVEIRVPRARKTELSFSVFTKYRRRWQELDELLLEAHIGGLSCRAAGERIAGLMGCSVSGTTVAKLKKALEEKLRSFKHAELKDEYKAIIVDGMFVRIKQCGRQKRPLVAAIGIKANGDEELLGIKICYSESSVEVEGLLRSIKERGVKGVNLDVVTIDGDRGLESAVYAVYGNVRIQSCTFHKINRLHQNAEGKKRGRRMMKDAAVAFSEEDTKKRQKALVEFCDRWREVEPRAIELFERKLYRCYEVNVLPKEIRSKAATTGRCEGLFKQLRGRINQIGAFQSPISVETYVYGIICQKKWINVPGRSIGDPLLSESTHSS
jgi:putative transposase